MYENIIGETLATEDNVLVPAMTADIAQLS